jgi:hypothetical protein
MEVTDAHLQRACLERGERGSPDDVETVTAALATGDHVICCSVAGHKRASE